MENFSIYKAYILFVETSLIHKITFYCIRMTWGQRKNPTGVKVQLNAQQQQKTWSTKISCDHFCDRRSQNLANFFLYDDNY